MSTLNKKKYYESAKFMADTLVKTWLCVAIVMLGIIEIRAAYVILGLLSLHAILNGKNPIYFGLAKSTVQSSRIIQYGMPMIPLLGLPFLIYALI